MEDTKPQNKESLRRTIMKQDEIFKHQVHELHRLYEMQKLLMTELNQPDHNHSFDLYIDCLQETGQRKGISSCNYRTSTSTSGTSRCKQYHDYHSDGTESLSDDINLSLTLSVGITSRPKTETRIDDNKSDAAGVPWFYEAFS